MSRCESEKPHVVDGFRESDRIGPAVFRFPFLVFGLAQSKQCPSLRQKFGGVHPHLESLCPVHTELEQFVPELWQVFLPATSDDPQALAV